MRLDQERKEEFRERLIQLKELLRLMDPKDIEDIWDEKANEKVKDMLDRLTSRSRAHD